MIPYIKRLHTTAVFATTGLTEDPSAVNVTFSNKIGIDDNTSATERYCLAVANAFSPGVN